MSWNKKVGDIIVSTPTIASRVGVGLVILMLTIFLVWLTAKGLLKAMEFTNSWLFG